jgi:hypothetical protein
LLIFLENDWIRNLTAEGIEPNPGPCNWKTFEKLLLDEIGTNNYDKIKEELKTLSNLIVEKYGIEIVSGDNLVKYIKEAGENDNLVLSADTLKDIVRIVEDFSGKLKC